MGLVLLRRALQLGRLPLLLLLLLEASAGAATFLWNGDGGNLNWATMARWTVTSGTDPDGLPDADDDVNFGPTSCSAAGGGADVNLTGAVTVNTLTMNNPDCRLYVLAALTVNGKLRIQRGFLRPRATNGVINVGSDLTLESDVEAQLEVFKIFVTGNLTMTGGVIYLDSGEIHVGGNANLSGGSTSSSGNYFGRLYLDASHDQTLTTSGTSDGPLGALLISGSGVKTISGVSPQFKSFVTVTLPAQLKRTESTPLLFMDDVTIPAGGTAATLPFVVAFGEADQTLSIEDPVQFFTANTTGKTILAKPLVTTSSVTVAAGATLDKSGVGVSLTIGGFLTVDPAAMILPGTAPIVFNGTGFAQNLTAGFPIGNVVVAVGSTVAMKSDVEVKNLTVHGTLDGTGRALTVAGDFTNDGSYLFDAASSVAFCCSGGTITAGTSAGRHLPAASFEGATVWTIAGTDGFAIDGTTSISAITGTTDVELDLSGGEATFAGLVEVGPAGILASATADQTFNFLGGAEVGHGGSGQLELLGPGMSIAFGGGKTFTVKLGGKATITPGSAMPRISLKSATAGMKWNLVDNTSSDSSTTASLTGTGASRSNPFRVAVSDSAASGTAAPIRPSADSLDNGGNTGWDFVVVLPPDASVPDAPLPPDAMIAADAAGPADPDAGPPADAPVATPDAAVAAPDAPVAAPDAAVAAPDAPVVEADASVVEPDAPVTEPDAPVPELDAREAELDAAPGSPDAGPTSTADAALAVDGRVATATIDRTSPYGCAVSGRRGGGGIACGALALLALALRRRRRV